MASYQDQSGRAKACAHGVHVMLRDTAADNPPVYHTLFWIIFIGPIRSTVLWFQTLIHGMHHTREDNRVSVVLGVQRSAGLR